MYDFFCQMFWIPEWVALCVGGYYISRIAYLASILQASDQWLTPAPEPKPLNPWERISLS